MRIEWNMTEGLEQLLRMVEEKSGQAVEAMVEAIEEGQRQLYDEYKDGLERHNKNDLTIDSLEIKPVIRDGNIISGEVGSFMEKNKAGFWHARYQEYGAKTKKGVVTFVADPWKRPADDAIRKKFSKIAKDILKRRLRI